MREEILKQYFDDLITSETLNNDVEASEINTGYDTTSIHVEQLNSVELFEVNSKNLLKLCNDARANNLKFKHLTTIGFALEFSEHFYWNNETDDGKIVGTVIFDWANPDINFPLTIENMTHWKTYLETGVYNLKFSTAQKKSDEG